MAPVTALRNISHRYVNPPKNKSNRTQSNRLLLDFNNFERHDPFIGCAEDWFAYPSGFDFHPHRGFETVTVVFEGELMHQDSRGNSGIVKGGGTQWTTIGRGIVHKEVPANRETEVHLIQLWLNLPKAKKTMTAEYQDIPESSQPVRTIVHEEEEVGFVKVLSGKSGDLIGPARNPGVEIKAIEVTILKSGVTIEELIPAHYNTWMYIRSGSAKIGAEPQIDASPVVLISPPTSQMETDDQSVLTIESVNASPEEPLKIVLFAGPPIREPVVQRGPFVMNEWPEILQAQRDYVEGKFYGL